MGFAVDTADKEELAHSGGNTLVEPCIAHVIIVAVKDGLGPNGAPIDGFTVELDVLAAKPVRSDVSPADLVGKKLNLTFWPPDLSKSEAAQSMTRRINTNFLLATNIITPDQLGKSFDVDPNLANGHQIIVRLEKQQKKEGDKWVDDKWLRVAFADIFHIDDPEVASVPKNVAALKHIQPQFRRKPEYFAYKAKGHTQSAPRQPQPAAAAVGGNDVVV